MIDEGLMCIREPHKLEWVTVISAILSTFNEADNQVFWANLKLLREFSPDQLEVIIVDGGSTDGTREKLQDVHVLPHSYRGERYNIGMELARGHRLLLVHPRSLLTREGVEFLLSLEPSQGWGAFRHTFDWSHPLLRFTSWYSNFIRGRGRGIYYLDHCLFLSADLRPHARFPSLAIFEDTHFCRALRRKGKPMLLPFSVTTSAIRFRRNGLVRQSVMNQVLKVLFFFGVSERWMNRVYERGLALNARE
jgi:glycosyltransferase involved in cell wall biosynthesis